MSQASSPSPHWSATEYDRNARFVSDLGAPVLNLLNPQPGERILDLGCGDGVLTARLVELGAIVTGVDSSADMLAKAQERGLDVHLMDGERLEFTAAFDAVFSNAALHWIRGADAVIAGVRRALRPGGRFVGEFGGFGNVAAIRVALHAVLRHRGLPVSDPWFYPSVAEYQAKLEAHGFQVTSIELIPRPTPLPTGMPGWLDTFAVPFWRALPPSTRDEVRDEVVELLRPALCDGAGNWIADYVRLRFAAAVA